MEHRLQTGYYTGGSQSPVVPQRYRPIQGQVQGHNIGFQPLPGPIMPMPPRYAVPLPNQMLFDGKYSWQSCIQPFQSTAMMCNWDEKAKLLRLHNSLRGTAADYFFFLLLTMPLNNCLHMF